MFRWLLLSAVVSLGALWCQEAGASDPPWLSDSLDKIDSLLKKGSYAEGESAARDLLAKVEASSGKESLPSAKVLDFLVAALRLRGKAQEPESLELAERAVRIKEKAVGPDDPELARSLSGLARLLGIAGDYTRAIALSQRALAVYEKSVGPEHPMVATESDALAVLFWETGEYAAARPLYERALAIREKALGHEDLAVAQILNDLAVLLQSTGDYSAARQLFERALAIREKELNPGHRLIAASLNNLARLLVALHDYSGSRVLYERAMVIREKALGPDHPDVAIGLNNLGSVLRKMGDYAGARPLLERALAIREKVLGPEHPLVASSLGNLGHVLGEMGEYDKAKDLDERALAIYERALGPDHPDVAEMLISSATILAENGETAAALDRALRGEKIAREHLRLTARTLPERQALLYASTRDSGLDLALNLIAGDPDAAAASKRSVWDAVIRSRALVLDEMAARHRTVGAAGDPEVARLIGELASSRERLAKLVVRGPGKEPPGRYLNLLEQARKEKESRERILAEKSFAFRQEQARGRLGLDEVIAALPPASALVGFVRYQDAAVPSYLAFILRAGESEPAAVSLGAAGTIDALVSSWRKQITMEAAAPGHSSKRVELACRAAGAALRRKVWDLIAPQLHGAKRVFVVPDGALHLVNLAALPVGQIGYLIERGPSIHHLSTERDLVLPGERARGEGLLALGNPAFSESKSFAAGGEVRKTLRGAHPPCFEFQSMRFEPLPASALEVEAIAALWKRGSDRQSQILLRGETASEAEFKQNAPGKRVLHLATHGFFLGENCATVGNENPLLLSGLALAGANRRRSAGPGEEDGILTAEEIAALDLDGVEWAVLSGCETGLGTVQAGEGVFGLRRAFQVAGAATVIMSLWPVQDEAARQWMAALYNGRFSQGLGTAEAVREASTELLRSRRAARQSTHPFYWAAFVATGDWR